MKTVKVRFLPADIEVEVPSGTSLFEARRMSGETPDAPCGGKGICNKCIVEVEEDDRRFMVKSCQYSVVNNIIIHMAEKGGNVRILTSGYEGKCEFKPMIRMLPFVLPEKTLTDARDDRTRLNEALVESAAISKDKEIYGSPKVYEKASKFASETSGKGFALLHGSELLDITDSPEKLFFAAIDIGTTTIAAYLIDAADGAELACDACLNSQIQYGGDVLSRAIYAESGGLDELSNSVRSDIRNLLKSLLDRVGVKASQLTAICFVGNTCMHHLLLGITPHSLIRVPYNASVTCPMTLKASNYGIDIHPEGKLFMLPLIAGFVGSDTVACLLAADCASQETITLIIDIGTNGELVLCGKNRCIACSTAAGPAFEGAKITCGMRAADGAIEHVFLNNNGNVSFSVIGGGKPSGICGSGVIDAVAVLYEAGIVTHTGRMLRPEKLSGDIAERFSGRLHKVGNEAVFQLSKLDESLAENGVYITQKDIRELQLGKSAISTGISILARKFGIEIREIAQVLIAGGFGNHMNVESLCKIGLIPSELKDRISFIGNAAGAGAKKAARNREQLQNAAEIARKTEFLELALSEEFQNSFLTHIDFPIIIKP